VNRRLYGAAVWLRSRVPGAPGKFTLALATATALVLLLAVVLVPLVVTVPRQPASSPPTNPIIEENKQPGSDAWRLGLGSYRVSDDATQQIKGYASATSVNKGDSIQFYLSTNPPQAYSIDIYRMGYYAGAGGRLMQHLEGDGTTQQPCPEQPDTGLIACNWAPAMEFDVPSTWTSGIYVGLLTNAQGYQDYIDFVVRDDGRPSELLYQQGIMTYEAYNDYPSDAPDRSPALTGKSLYGFNSSLAPTQSIDHTRATKVSFDRPFSQPSQGTFLDWDVYTVEWLEQSGYDVTYSTDVDTDRNPGELLKHKAFVSAGHDEYWTRGAYDAALVARDAGVNLAFLGGNAVYWQARLEPSAAGTPDRVIVCYRDPELDPVADTSLKTVQWRDPLLGRPEQTLIGVQYVGGLATNAPFVVSQRDPTWAYADTGFADHDQVPAEDQLRPDGTGAIVGYEADGFDPAYPPPPTTRQVLLSASPFTDNFGQPHLSNASLYKAEKSGAWVFASGTMSWSWALARPGYIDSRIQRLTTNIVDRLVAADVVTSGHLSVPEVRRGKAVTITASAQNPYPRPARLLLDVAVLGSDGSVQFQDVFTDELLQPGEQRTYEANWAVPADALVGSDRLIVAGFGPEWAPMRNWDDWVRDASTFTVD
jgi:hypothetical protein